MSDAEVPVPPAPFSHRKRTWPECSCLLIVTVIVLGAPLYAYLSFIRMYNESERMPARHHDLYRLDSAFRAYRSRFGSIDSISFHETLLRCKADDAELDFTCGHCGEAFHVNSRPIRELADRAALAWCPECGRRRDEPLVLQWNAHKRPDDNEIPFSRSTPSESLSDLKPLPR